MGACEKDLEATLSEQGKNFWRKELPVVNDKGAVITGGMWEHQREWWDAPNFYKTLVTGYGGGKTLIGSKRSISCAIHNAPVPHICVSPTYKLARRTTIPTIKNLLYGKKTLMPDALDFTFNKSDFEFTIYYKDRVATIWVLSGEDPDSLRGPNVGSALIDEPFIQDREVFDQVVARVRDPAATHLEIGMTGTPEDLNWGYDICEGEEAENFDMHVVHASSRANKALTDDYVKRLEGTLTSRATEAYVDGKFVSLSEGLVYYAFSDQNVVEIDITGWERLGGMDFNVDPMAATLLAKRGNHLHAYDEIELPNSDTEEMCAEIKERDPHVHDIYPDASGRQRHSNAPGGKSDFWYIEQANMSYHVHSQNPARRDRFNSVNGKFKAKNGDITLTVSPKCKKLIRYLKTYSHRQANEPYQKAMSHLLDSLGYPVAYLFPVRKPFEMIEVVGH